MSDLSIGSVTSKVDYHSLDFKLVIDDVKSGQQKVLHVVVATRQEKAAWITDIAQVRGV